MNHVRREILEREMLAQPVRSLQYMLRRLSMVYDFLPRLVTDGIFGERTLEAVMLFQRELHPPVTGVVDRGTWEAIRTLWDQVEREISGANALRAFPSEGTRVEPGAEAEYMIMPQTMFQVLGRHLNGITEGPALGIHDRASVDNVHWLQHAAGLKEDGVMDRRTWEMLVRLYEIFVIRELDRSRQAFLGGWG